MIYKHSLKNTQWLRHKVKKAHFINGRIGECRRLPVQSYFKIFGKKLLKKDQYCGNSIGRAKVCIE